MKRSKAGDRWPREIRAGSASTKIFRIKHHGTKSGFAFVVAWYANGQRKRQKFANQSDALHEARLRAEQINSGQIEAAGFSKQDRDELLAARNISGNVPLLAALKEWRRAHSLTSGNIIPACEAWASRNSTAHDRRNVSDVVKLYLAAKSKAGIRTADNHGHIFRDISRDFGDRIIDTITAREIDAWLARWENAGTRLTFRKWTVALWRWAQKQNYLSREVKTEAEHTESVRKADMEIGIITADTYGKLLGHFHALHPDYLPALVLAGFCGLRRAEVHNQRWEDINLVSGHLRVSSAKRGTPSRRLVPLCHAAVEWLSLTADRTEWVCSNLAIDRIRNIAKDADYALPENCFRHSFISHRVAATGNIAETSLIAGNSPTIVQKHYLELVTKSEGEAWFNLNPTKELGEAAKAHETDL